ncbi:hypothetical protein LSAT2_007730 [Lamellibrachia satsuma]|nr:hypothetical protein LSAT2_007730 [Lamellibrachia satsuma]
MKTNGLHSVDNTWSGTVPPRECYVARRSVYDASRHGPAQGMLCRPPLRVRRLSLTPNNYRVEAKTLHSDQVATWHLPEFGQSCSYGTRFIKCADDSILAASWPSASRFQ